MPKCNAQLQLRGPCWIGDPPEQHEGVMDVECDQEHRYFSRRFKHASHFVQDGTVKVYIMWTIRMPKEVT